MVLSYLILFTAHFFAWWLFLFLFSIIRNYTAFIFKPKDCLKVAVVSYLLHLAIRYLIENGRLF